MKADDFKKKLAAIPEEAPDETDLAMIAASEPDGDTKPLEDIKRAEDFSGKLLIRIPKTLHRELTIEAKNDGVSLNQYVLYKLSRQ